MGTNVLPIESASYTVYCNTSASQAYPEQMIAPNVPTVRSVVNGTTQATLFTTGLTLYTQYNCYVTANTSVGEGTPSQIMTARTDQSSKQNHDIRTDWKAHIRKH